MDAGDASRRGTYISAGEVAGLLGVSVKTVSRWADKGFIPCVVTLGGHRRFLRNAVEHVRQEMYGGGRAATPDGTLG